MFELIKGLIRKNITPIGDGNYFFNLFHRISLPFIRKNITPIGDGNLQVLIYLLM